MTNAVTILSGRSSDKNLLSFDRQVTVCVSIRRRRQLVNESLAVMYTSGSTCYSAQIHYAVQALSRNMLPRSQHS